MKPVFLSSHGNKSPQHHQLCAQGCSSLFLCVLGNWADILGFAVLENEEHLVQHFCWYNVLIDLLLLATSF